MGRFCLNCGHPIGAPAPAVPRTATTPTMVRPPADPPADSPAAPPADRSAKPPVEPPVAPAAPRAALPVQAADPTPLPPAAPPAAPDWDPELDLLPYEEVDELETEDPLAGRAWLFWVVGAVALVALVLVLLRVFDSEPVDDTATEQPAGQAGASPGDGSAAPDDPEAGSEGSGEDEAPQGVGPRVDLAESATFTAPGTAPPTQDFDGNLVAYEASQMGDGNPATTWRTPGDASGQSVTITLAQAGVINRVGLVNGYAKKVAGVDWYPNNRRILGVTWAFDDGSSVDQTFAERPAMQMLKVPPVETGTVTLTITSVTPPGAGPLGRDYTAISEIALMGRNAA